MVEYFPSLLYKNITYIVQNCLQLMPITISVVYILYLNNSQHLYIHYRGSEWRSQRTPAASQPGVEEKRVIHAGDEYAVLVHIDEILYIGGQGQQLQNR